MGRPPTPSWPALMKGLDAGLFSSDGHGTPGKEETRMGEGTERERQPGHTIYVKDFRTADTIYQGRIEEMRTRGRGGTKS